MNAIQPLNLDEQITVSMASIPERVNGMYRTLESLLPYCDNFDLCLNGYGPETVLPFDDPKIHVVYMDERHDAGAGGKFYMAHRTPGYFLTVDDDIIYPSDYIPKLIQAIERYKRMAIVGYHGMYILKPDARHLITFEEDLGRDLPVHILGTGVMGYHSSLFCPNRANLLPGKIDEQIAIMAQHLAIPMILLEHRRGWLKDVPDMSHSPSALRSNTDLRIAAWERVRNFEWRLYATKEQV